MIRVKLRLAMERHLQQTGQRVTYDDLAEMTGLSRVTLEALGSRPGYNATLSTIDRLCSALNCSLPDLLEREPEEKTPAADRGEQQS